MMYKIKEFYNLAKAKYETLNPIAREIIETVIFVLVMVIIIRFFIGEIRWIPSASMHPTLLDV